MNICLLKNLVFLNSILFTDYVKSAAFVHTAETKRFAVALQENLWGTQITPLAFDKVVREPEKLLRDVGHVVISGPLQTIKQVLFLSMTYDFTVGLIPMNHQKDLIKCFALPRKINLSVDLSLWADAQAMDLILCNRIHRPAQRLFGYGGEGYALLINALNRCTNKRDAVELNQMIRNTSDVKGITGKIKITDGKANRPLL